MIIGIDLGTTYSLCAYYDGEKSQLIPNAQGGYLTPSEIFVGQDVAVGFCPSPKDYPHHFRYFKEFMGTEKEYKANDQVFTPLALSTLILSQLKTDAEAFLGQEITEAIISVPAYFNDNQRSATKQAGQLAGLNTTRLVNEPSAAALAYHFGYDEAGLMILDFGGGTFDVSLVDCFDHIIEITAISGDNHLGGKNIDQIMADHFCKHHNLPSPDETLLKELEQVKEQLASHSQILFRHKDKELCFSRPLLKELCHPLFQQIRQIIAQALSDCQREGNIDQIILVGGSSHLVGFSDYIQELFDIKPLCAQNPQTVVALGMGYYAGMKSRHQNLSELILTDVCPFTLGVATVHNTNDLYPHVTPLIPRNTTLPASASANFKTIHSGQTEIQIQVLQGEGYFLSDNLLLDTIVFTVPIPEGRKLPPAATVTVTFTYDLNGILQVDVTHQGVTTTHNILSNKAIENDPKALAQILSRLKASKIAKQAPETDPFLRKANQFFATIGYREKDILRNVLDDYRKAQLEGLIPLRKMQRKLQYLLDKLTQWQESDKVLSETFLDFLSEFPDDEFQFLEDDDYFDDDE